MTTKLEERVENGMKFFGSKHPEILQNVNLETLDMADVCKCMLGQSYGHFDDGLYELDLILHDLVRMGLDVWTDEEYDTTELTPIWKTKIEAWRNEHVSVSSSQST